MTNQHDLDDEARDVVCRLAGVAEIAELELVQSLWSGYGQILRVRLDSQTFPSLIVKLVAPKGLSSGHPRGWNSDASHQRKLKSYDVEAEWYRRWSSMCDSSCRVPKTLAVEWFDSKLCLVLEDLDDNGYDHRFGRLNDGGITSCLHWLANFHATFMLNAGSDAESQRWPEGGWGSGLWPVGTYWHLETRQDEWDAMEDGPLKDAAEDIDRALSNTRYRTLVHGDAKVANFCFDSRQHSVAGVDFQYVGGGCGMKDVAYFMGSCLSELECARQWDDLLDVYFAELRRKLNAQGFSGDVPVLESDWRRLFPIAWADFHRFLLGWCPTHQKLTQFSDAMVEKALAIL